MPLQDDDRKTVAKLEAKLAPLLSEVNKWKGAINAIYEASDEPPPYTIDGVASTTAAVRYGRTEFFNQPLQTVVRRLIQDNGPQTDDELYDRMIAHGFQFEESNPVRAKGNLKISLGKSAAFVKSPNGYYTLNDSPRQRKPNALTASTAEIQRLGDPNAPTE